MGITTNSVAESIFRKLGDYHSLAHIRAAVRDLPVEIETTRHEVVLTRKGGEKMEVFQTWDDYGDWIGWGYRCSVELSPRYDDFDDEGLYSYGIAEAIANFVS